MSIRVTDSEFNPRLYPDATGYHVDEDRRLHVTKTGEGNIATFHPNAWVSVERVPAAAVS